MENNQGNMSAGEKEGRRIPVTPVNATGNFVQLHLGGFFICCLAVGGLALEWFDYTTATGMVVMFGLMLALGYGWQAVRWHRATPREPLTNQFKVASVLVGLAAVAGLLKVMYNAGPLTVSGVMLALLYVFFAYLSLLMALRRKSLLWMVGVNTLCGLAGWGLLAVFLINLHMRYIAVLAAPEDGKRLAIVEMCSRIAGWLPYGALLALALLLMVAAFLLRIELYHRISGCSRRSLLVSVHTIIVTVMAFAGIIFVFTANRISEKRVAAAVEEINRQFALDLTVQRAVPMDLNAEFRGRFQAFARKWSEAEMNYHQREAEKFPYRWANGNIAYLWWRTPGDDGKFIRQMNEANAAIEPLYSELDELLASVPAPQPGVLPNYTIRSFMELTAAWRLRTSLVNGDFPAAVKAWQQLGKILRDRSVLASPPGTVAVSLNKWIDMTESMLSSGKCSGEWLRQIENEAALWQEVLAQPQQPAMRVYIAQFYNALDKLKNDRELDFPPAYAQIRCFFPVPWMMATAEQMIFLKRFVNAAKWEEVAPGKRGNGSFYTNYMLDVICDGAGQLEEAVNRMNSLVILAAVKQRLMDNGGMPQTIAQLVPQYLKKIPADCSGENREFRLAMEKRPFQIFECSRGYIIQEQRNSIVVALPESVNTAASMLSE